jgi:hypothetical protein
MLTAGIAPRPAPPLLPAAMCVGVGWWLVATNAPRARQQAREVRGSYREVKGLLQLRRQARASSS